MRIVGDIIEFTAQQMPKFNSISISAITCRRPAPTRRWSWPSRWPMGRSTHRDRRRLERRRLAPRLSFFWAIGMNFYLEIAKMRAARLLWCRIMKDVWRPEPQSLMLAPIARPRAGA